MILISESPFARDHAPLLEKVKSLNATHYYPCRDKDGAILRDLSGNGNHGTITTTHGNSFNGSYLRLWGKHGDYATLPSSGIFNNPNGTGFTVMMWVNSSGLTYRDQWYRFMELSSSTVTAPQNTFELTKNRDDNSIFVNWSSTSWSGFATTLKYLSGVNEEWIHITYTLANNVQSLFINGTKIGENAPTIIPVNANRAHMFLGRTSLYDASMLFTCSYSDIMFFNTKVSDVDVAEIWFLLNQRATIYGTAFSSSIPPIPAKVIMVRRLPDGKTNLIPVDQQTGYWEVSVDKNYVYDVCVYGQDGSIYKPQIYGPMEV